ncbi:M23 family metallopeptidase [Streptomyces capillispiralis]|nr:M23 family metallopeptidase [Streptomyces capillispiralis]
MADSGRDDSGDIPGEEFGARSERFTRRPWGEQAPVLGYVPEQQPASRRPGTRTVRVLVSLAVLGAVVSAAAFLWPRAGAGPEAGGEAGTVPAADGNSPTPSAPAVASPGRLSLLLPLRPGSTAGRALLEQATVQEKLAAAFEQAVKDERDRIARVRERTEAERAERRRAGQEQADRERAARERAADAAADAAPESGMVLPLSDYTLTSTFGQAGKLWSSGRHTGLDFAAPTGTPLRAVGEGSIVEVTRDGPLGNRTVLRLLDGTEVDYCHQADVSVAVGQRVEAGAVIGRVGETGNTTGPHLHLEVRTAQGGLIDPGKWLREAGLRL